MTVKANILFIALIILAIVSAALSVFYFSVDTDFLASDFDRHINHAIAFAGLAVALLAGAFVVRRRRR